MQSAAVKSNPPRITLRRSGQPSARAGREAVAAQVDNAGRRQFVTLSGSGSG